VCGCPCYIILVELCNLPCGPDPKMHTYNVCTREVFQILFLSLFQRQNMSKAYTVGGKQNVVLNTVPLKNVLHFL
jgi:hypothetical protein